MGFRAALIILSLGAILGPALPRQAAATMDGNSADFSDISKNWENQRALFSAGLAPAAFCPTPQVPVRDPEVDKFCRDPFEAICADPETHRTTIDARLAEVTQQIERDAIQSVAERMKLDPGQLKSERDILAIVDWEKRREVDSMYTKERERVKSERIQNSEFRKTIASDSEWIRETLMKSVEASELPLDARKRFLDYLKQTKILTQDQANTRFEERRAANKDTREDFELVASAESSCDHGDGFRLNAFSQDISMRTGKRTAGTIHVIVCSGFLFSAMDPQNNGYPIQPRLAMVLGHEMSHIMSARWEPGLYEQLYQCVMKHQSEDLLESHLAYVKKMGHPMTVAPNERDDFKKKLVRRHMEEIGADDWGKRSVIQALKSAKKTPTENLRFLRGAYGLFCINGNNGIHPSGKYRIEHMGWDPQIRTLMGCTSALHPKHPVCGLAGEVKP